MSQKSTCRENSSHNGRGELAAVTELTEVNLGPVVTLVSLLTNASNMLDR